MELKEWIKNNTSIIPSKIKTEEDVKMHIICPFLEYLGYKKNRNAL